MSKMKAYIFDLFDDDRFTFKDFSQIQDAEFWSSDKDANLSFKIARQGFNINKATINLYNKSDKTLILDRPMTITNNEARFKMPLDIIKHFGAWSAQVIFNELHTSPTVSFDVFRKLGDNLPEKMGLLHEWENLHDEVKAFVAEIEGFTLEEFVALKMGEELANLETNYATRLTGLEQKDNQLAAQLAQITYHVTNFDGVTDNEKIVNAFAFMNGLLGEGHTLSFPSKQTPYILTSSVVCNGKWNIKMETAIQYNGSGTGVTIKDAIRRSYEIMMVKGTNYGGWFTDVDLTSVGVQFDNVNFSEINLKDIRGFYTNVLFDNSDNKGSCYNNIFIGLIYDAYINLYFKQRVLGGASVSWNNQNQIYGGAIKISGHYTPVKNGTALIKNEGNNNTIIGTALEGNRFQYSIHTIASDNQYINCRYEQNLNGSLKFKGPNCKFNIVLGGYDIKDSLFSIESPINVTVLGNGRLSNLNNSNTHPQPVLKGHTLGQSTNLLIELGLMAKDQTLRKTFSLAGNGTMSLFHDVTGTLPQLELKGRDGQINFGNGTDPTVNAFMVNVGIANTIDIQNFLYRVRNNSSFYYELNNLASNVTNFDVTKGHFFITANTEPTDITHTTGGQNGKIIYLLCKDTFTTLKNNSVIKTKNKADRLLQVDEVIQFVRLDGGVLYEI